MFKSVDEYIAAQSDSLRRSLQNVRSAIRHALPDAAEVISYNMPTYKLNGAPVIHFAGWTKHYSVYGATKSVQAAFKNDLRPYKIEKGTIQFPLSEPVPVKLIEQIAKFRAREVVEKT